MVRCPSPTEWPAGGSASLGCRAGFSGPAACLAEWLWRAHSACRENDCRGCVRLGSPSGVDGQRAPACAGAQPVADELALEEERAAGASFGRGPLAFGDKRAVGDAHGREIEDLAEVEGEAGAAGMVSAGGVDQEGIRLRSECAHGGFEQSSLSESQPSRLVRRARSAGYDDRLPADAGRRPGRVARVAGAGAASGEADEDAADSRVGLEAPRLRLEGGQA
jgi:hypothetical protein